MNDPLMIAKQLRQECTKSVEYGDWPELQHLVGEFDLAMKNLGSISVGDKVEKVGGDYRFDSTIVAVFKKLSGEVRVVAEDDRGILHIFSEKNLRIKP